MVAQRRWVARAAARSEHAAATELLSCSPPLLPRRFRPSTTGGIVSVRCCCCPEQIPVPCCCPAGPDHPQPPRQPEAAARQVRCIWLGEFAPLVTVLARSVQVCVSLCSSGGGSNPGLLAYLPACCAS